MATGNGEGWRRQTRSNVINNQAGQLNQQQAPRPLPARNQRQQLRANPPQLTVNGLPIAANHGNSNGRNPLQHRSDLEDALRNTTGFTYGLGGHAPEQGAGDFNRSSRLHGRHFQWERTTGHAFQPFSAGGRSRVAPQAEGNGNRNRGFMCLPTNNLSQARNIHPLLGENFNRGQTSSGPFVGGDVAPPLVIPNSRGHLGLAPSQSNPRSLVYSPIGLRSAEAQAFANSSLQPFPNAFASAPQLPSHWADTGRLRLPVTTLPPNAVHGEVTLGCSHGPGNYIMHAVQGTPAAWVNPVPALVDIDLQNGLVDRVLQARALRAMLFPRGDVNGRDLWEQPRSGLMTLADLDLQNVLVDRVLQARALGAMLFPRGDVNGRDWLEQPRPGLMTLADLDLQNVLVDRVLQARALEAMLFPRGDVNGRDWLEQPRSGLMTSNGVQGGFNGAYPSTFSSPSLRIIPNSQDEIAPLDAFLRFISACPLFNDEMRNSITWLVLLNLRNFLADLLPSGLDQETITENLGVQVYGSATTPAIDEPCCICLEEYVDGDNVSKLECEHAFHYDCIRRWLTEKNNCPICKRIAIEESEDFVPDSDSDSESVSESQ